ncbi:unnamed protein product [Arabidopsis lyrata]|nr:unnamed protein product [Arabidopsis lyrata]
MTLRLERPEGVLRPDLVVIEIEFRLVYVGVRSEPKWLGFYRIYLVMEDSERCPNGFPVILSGSLVLVWVFNWLIYEIGTPFVRFSFSVYRGFCSKLDAGSGSNREASPIWFYGGLEGVDGWSVEQSKSWRWAIGQRFPQGNGLWFSNLLVFEMIYHPFLMIDLFQRSLVSYKVSYSHNFVGRERNISVEISDQKGKHCSRLEKLILGGFSSEDEYGLNVEDILEEIQKGDTDYKVYTRFTAWLLPNLLARRWVWVIIKE